jgi:hypothetical protein
MIKLTLETETKTVEHMTPSFNPNTTLFDYIWEFRNVLIGYGFGVEDVDNFLFSRILDDIEDMDDESFENDTKKGNEIKGH